MHAPSYASHDEPQDKDAAIAMLRAQLCAVTDTLESVLENGRPKRGKSRDDQEACDAWYEDKWSMVRRAREALALTACPCTRCSSASTPCGRCTTRSRGAATTSTTNSRRRW